MIVCVTLPRMARYGYARIPTRSQRDDSQLDALRAAGCERIWADTASGKLARRPEWDNCLDHRSRRTSRSQRARQRLRLTPPVELFRSSASWRPVSSPFKGDFSPSLGTPTQTSGQSPRHQKRSRPSNTRGFQRSVARLHVEYKIACSGRSRCA
jgi:hypothetical protein